MRTMFARIEQQRVAHHALFWLVLLGVAGPQVPGRADGPNPVDPRSGELAREVRGKGWIVYGARTAMATGTCS